MSELQGGQLLGKYLLQEKLGAGGMGEVWKAKHSIIESREVAIKVMLPGSHLLEESVKRFIREASVLSELGGHPHIVQIHDIDMFDEGQYFIVMEYVPDSLARKLGDDEMDGGTVGATGIGTSLLPMEDIIRMGREICLGLQTAHAQGIIHRDLKPENILIASDGTVKLCDFGVALVSGVSRLTAVGLGSPIYTAPEVFRDAHSADARADIYSLGALLYRMTTGEIPMGVVTPPTEINTDVPAHINDLILNCLKRHADRPDSVDAVLDALSEPTVSRSIEPSSPEAGETISTPFVNTGLRAPEGLEDLWQEHDMRLKGMGFVVPPDQDVVIKNPKDDGIALWIPPGDFLYGEDKKRKTIVEGFYLDVYPVTNAQYARFVSATGHQIPCCDDFEQDWCLWVDKHPPKGYEDHPVIHVSWEDAISYCNWSGKYLPNEIQWEYSARGVDDREYPWGDEEPTDGLANYGGNVGKTTEVGLYPSGASAFGILDMPGNVWEWAEGIIRYNRSVSNKDDELLFDQLEHLFKAPDRVVRGGSWGNGWDAVTCAYRLYDLPDPRYPHLGFRCAWQK